MAEFAYMPWDVMLARLLMSAAAGAVVGLERERREQPAGFRTHMLVSVGACLATLVSIGVAGEQFDPGRVAAGVVTGIGFLGAGTIIRYGGSVHGLTTAASIWAVATVGMAAGIGWWQAVLACTLLLFLGLAGLKWIELKAFPERRPLTLRVEVDERKLSLPGLRSALVALGGEILSVEATYNDDTDTSEVVMGLEHLPDAQADEMVAQLAKMGGVRSVRRG
jgi:putative Mg2+ transporter-C (MgtC) family protein